MHTTPPFFAMALMTSSGMFRTMGVTPFAEEWDASTGAALSSTASSTALSEMCDTSTIIPIRFISRTSSRPSFDSPLWVSPSVIESAKALDLKWASVM